MTDDLEYYGTHYDECWKGGRKHYGCAVAEIERLQGELAQARAQAAAWKRAAKWWRNGESIHAYHWHKVMHVRGR